MRIKPAFWLKVWTVWWMTSFTANAWAGAYEDFFKAVTQNDVTEIRQLLSRGFDPNTPSPTGQQGLIMALREPSLEVARVLMQSPTIDVNRHNRQDESALMMAALKGLEKEAAQLLKLGADVNKTGWAPLHYAATSGSLAIAKLLIDHHAYIDAESPNGSTPLMMAAMYGTASMVKLLLEEGADPLIKNQLELTAIDFAQQANKTDAVNIIAAFVRAKQPKGVW